MLKFLAPLILLFAVVLIFLSLVRYFTLRLDLTSAFNIQVTPQTPQDGIFIKLNGVDGDSAIVGISTSESGASEEIEFTGKNLDNIKAGLNKFQLGQWEFMTKLPEAAFRFNVYLLSDSDSPNKAKKIGNFVVSVASGTPFSIPPGKYRLLGNNVPIAEISETIENTNIKLVYEDGWYNAFYDEQGNFISQSTGTLVLKPTVFTQLLMVIGVWTFAIAFIALTKQTLLLGKDILETVDYLRKP